MQALLVSGGLTSDKHKYTSADQLQKRQKIHNYTGDVTVKNTHN